MIDRIEREMELPASLERAWEAVTEPAWLTSWLADEVELELTPGGSARFRLADRERTGWVEEVAAPDEGGEARLVFWWSAGDAPASRVELTLTVAGEQTTIVRVVETRPLEILDLVGIPAPGAGGSASPGPMLVAR